MIGAGETADFLRDRPVSLIWGVGHSTLKALNDAGIRSFADLLRWDRRDLNARFGSMGDRLWHLARGQDRRRVSANAPVKSISNETTFYEDTRDRDLLDGHIWRLAEKVADRAKARALAGRVVTLKLKRADHTLLTRRHALRDATQLADTLYRTARALLDRSGDLLDPQATRRAGAERATDTIRAKFGPDAIVKGRALR